MDSRISMPAAKHKSFLFFIADQIIVNFQHTERNNPFFVDGVMDLRDEMFLLMMLQKLVLPLRISTPLCLLLQLNICVFFSIKEPTFIDQFLYIHMYINHRQVL